MSSFSAWFGKLKPLFGRISMRNFRNPFPYLVGEKVIFEIVPEHKNGYADKFRRGDSYPRCSA